MLYFPCKRSKRDPRRIRAGGDRAAVNRGMRVRFPREAVTVKRVQTAFCTPKSEDLPVPYSRGMRRRTRIRGLPDEYGAVVRCPVFSLFSLCDLRYNIRKERWITKKRTKIILAVALLLVLVIGALLVWQLNKPAAQEGGKKLVVTVVHGDGSSKDFAIATDAEFLRGALEEQQLIEGSESEYGLFVTAVDGETADDALQQWWCFTKGGEMLMTGVDTTPIADGEHYEITLTTGW